ncbi:Uncharacterized protein dnm_002890 [Desulfonema magnum]|uniref:Uncharacterized protein n=1 Tax=Desulfonema magnum TaxID=45655 RepID=A0A975BFU8_9BACT|nr:Uncharacterized protein dnm_002890 [Desulfonema magnum]
MCPGAFVAVFLQRRHREPVRKAIPNGSGVQKLYFCACEKAFFALRRKYR